MTTRCGRRSGLFAVAAFLLLIAVAPQAALAAGTKPCVGAGAYRALDFTLGTWAVTAPDGSSEGPSTIRPGLNGCVVVEDWGGPDDGGRNFDAYSADDRRWHRLFVDGAGRVHVFTGVSDGAAIRYLGTSRNPDGTTSLNRVTIRPLGGNSFDELWQKSPDGEKTWKTVFEGIYRRANP